MYIVHQYNNIQELHITRKHDRYSYTISKLGEKTDLDLSIILHLFGLVPERCYPLNNLCEKTLYNDFKVN